MGTYQINREALHKSTLETTTFVTFNRLMESFGSRFFSFCLFLSDGLGNDDQHSHVSAEDDLGKSKDSRAMNKGWGASLPPDPA